MDFRELYEANLSYVWNGLRRFGVEARHLEDAAHEVFIVVHRKLDTYDPSRPLRPWLTGITFRVASDFRKKASTRREHMDDELDPVDPKPGPEAAVEANQQRELVHRALGTLSEDQRTVFVMHDLEGLSVPEISELVGAGKNTCYSRLRLAREAFTKAVRRLQKEDAR